MAGHAFGFAVEHEIVSASEHQIASEVAEERSFNDKWVALSDRLVGVGMIAYLTSEVAALRYDTSFTYHFISVLFIVVGSFVLLSAIDRRVASGNRSFKQLFLLAQKLLNIAVTYFTFILVTLFASAVQPLVDNSFWNFTRIIPPLLIVLLIYAAPLLIDLEFYLPLNVADDLKTRSLELAKSIRSHESYVISSKYLSEESSDNLPV